MGSFYVYVWFRPWNGQPCYVGKGQGNRYQHWGRSRNLHLLRLIKKSGGELPTVIIRNRLSEKMAHKIEMVFIKAIGRGKLGPLVNGTDGGEGKAGAVHSAKTKRKISIKAIGRVITDEVKLKISRALKGRKKHSGHGANVSAGLKGHKVSALTRKLIGDANRGRKHPNRPPVTEEVKARLREANLGKRVSKKTRAKMSAAHLGKKHVKRWSEESRERQRQIRLEMSRKKRCQLLQV